ncbi:MAG: TonB-dependent receptor [Bacteroidales bacterium]
MKFKSNSDTKGIVLFKLLFFMLLAFPLSGFAQSQKVSLNVDKTSLKNVLSLIEKQTNYRFSYRDAVLPAQSDISYNEENITVKDVLTSILSAKNLSFSVNGNNISISPKKGGATKRITGTIIDNTGEPVIGANVVVEGTTDGTITDFDGNFTLNAPEGGNIKVTYIGYEPMLVAANANAPMKITLKDDSQALEEVVVVGYGTQKKVNLTGSVAAISSDDIKDRVQTNVLSAVQGTVPGVTIISRPGQTPSINFRGRGNLGSSEPLYVIDGAIADATFFSNLDPNSIESISFLKDAASSAIYGSRAAYGVVLVTTKNGKKDKLNITYNGYVGVKNPTYLPDMVNSWEYAELLNEAFYNRDASKGWNQAYSNEQIEMFKNGSNPDMYPNTDWADLVLKKNAITTQHSMNFSGGSEKIRFFSGLGYLFDDKYFPGQHSDRYNFNVNASADLTDWITLKTGVKYIRNTSDRDRGAPSLMNFLLTPSTMVAKHSNGLFGTIAGGTQATQTFINGNPLRALEKNDWSNSKADNTMIDLGFDFKPVKGLTISGQGVFKGYEYKSKSYTGLFDDAIDFISNKPIPGTGVYTNRMDMNWQSSNRMLYMATAKYDWKNAKNDISALIGTSYEHYKYEGQASSRKNFPTDGLPDMNAGSSAEMTNSGGMSENKIGSYFARLNYSLMDKYLLEANVRTDGSSSFHRDNRWGIFPSFSAGWRINQEEFLKNIAWIDNLKVRASWGKLGNINNVGYYDYFQNYRNNQHYNFEDTPVIGIMETKPANSTLGWEKVAITDFGIDFDILNGKWNFVADYYIKNTSDILLAYNVPKETGISTSPAQNIGKVKNNGLEFAVTHRNTIGAVNYTVGANFAWNKNIITDLGSADNDIRGGGDKINYILKEGESIGSFYGYKTDGLYTQEEIDRGEYYILGRVPNAGDIKYVPQRKGVPFKSNITPEDRTILGKDVPDFTYGLNISVMYKNFEFSMFGQGVSGTKAAFESEQVWAFFLNSNPRAFHLDRWSPNNPNPNAPYPRIYGGHSYDNYNQNFSDFQLFDADYFRFKTMSLGYQFPKNLISKTPLSALKMFLTAENLFTIRADKKMRDFDPEASSGRGLGALGAKSVAFGLNVSF